MTKSCLQDRTEPAVFVPEVAKQHDVFAGAIAFGVLVSARASFWLNKKIRKLLESFHEDLPKPALVPRLYKKLFVWRTFRLSFFCIDVCILHHFVSKKVTKRRKMQTSITFDWINIFQIFAGSTWPVLSETVIKCSIILKNNFGANSVTSFSRQSKFEKLDFLEWRVLYYCKNSDNLHQNVKSFI